MMKAIEIEQFGSSDVLKVKEIDIPFPNESEVLVEVISTSVNFADIKTRKGNFHAAGDPPLIIGLEAVGIVKEVGKHVTTLKPGDKVITITRKGSYAQYILGHEDLTYKIPDESNVSYFEGATLVTFTAYSLLKEVGNIKQDEYVVIFGAAGGVGTTAIQIARFYGAKRVIAIVSTEEKKSMALHAGASDVFLANDLKLPDKILSITNNRGADLIIDCYAGQNGENCLQYLSKLGRLVVFGDASGEAALYNSKKLHSNCQTVSGFSIGTIRDFAPSYLKNISEQVIKLLAEQHVTIKIGARYNLEDAKEAHDLIESRTSTGKIIIDVLNRK